MSDTSKIEKYETNKTIHIGLVMAGAVTAGAYTAGAIDYLLDTLKLWHKKHKEDPEKTPKPNVVIDVLTGASAGSIASAVTLLGLATNKLSYVHNPASAKAGDQISKNNLLYDTWVNLGTKEEDDLIAQMLNLEDINSHEKVRSLLNTNFIDRIIDNITNTVLSSDIVKDLPEYINPNLEVLMTLSNLRGIPIDLYFNNNNTKASHTMSYHKAYAYFEYNKPSNGTSDKLPLCLNYKGDTKIDCLNQLDLFLRSARASGAFPIGLRSVAFKKVLKDYIGSNIETLFGEETNIKPDIKGDYDFLAVDGGMTNNEPIAEALRILKQKSNGNHHKLILIDPFPNYIKDHKETEYLVEKDSLINIIPQLYGTLRNQSMFKESDIIDIFKEQNDKHMIWPTRYNDNGELLKNNIACGALAGFSGFLSRDFRVHDYALGKKNCQSFLRHYFNMPLSDNPKESHPSAKFWSEKYRSLFKILENNQESYPIIPDFSIKERRFQPINKSSSKNVLWFYPNLRNQVPPFPSISFNKTVHPIYKPLKKRLKKVIKNSFDELKKSDQKANDDTLVKNYFKDGILDRIVKNIGSIFMCFFGINALASTVSKMAMKQIYLGLLDYKLIKNKNHKK